LKISLKKIFQLNESTKRKSDFPPVFLRGPKQKTFKKLNASSTFTANSFFRSNFTSNSTTTTTTAPTVEK
jgi:hypothetical protein